MQVQGLMEIFQREWCNIYLWTVNGSAMFHIPRDRQVTLTKPEIAIEEIDRVIASGARFGCVLADSGYGSSGAFRQALNRPGFLGG